MREALAATNAAIACWEAKYHYVFWRPVTAIPLADTDGNPATITVDNDLLIGVTRSFRSFSEALDEVKNVRVFAGIHFRSACDDGQATGIQVANWVLDHALLPVH
jgi:hypothetical protein